eukprot:scaffold156680_cov40-Tisochrysis_lutea.AAC.1
MEVAETFLGSLAEAMSYGHRIARVARLGLVGARSKRETLIERRSPARELLRLRHARALHDPP